MNNLLYTVTFVPAGDGCMANDAAYFRANSTNPTCIGTGATREEAVNALILNLEIRKRQGELIFGLTRQNCSTALNALCSWCRHANDQWWKDPATGEKLTRNKGELIALMHSELSEALEGTRKNLQDDKLPQYPMELVEMADCLIRIFDYLGEYCQDQSFGEIFLAKMEYNANRADHKAENRLKDGGKQF